MSHISRLALFFLFPGWLLIGCSEPEKMGHRPDDSAANETEITAVEPIRRSGNPYRARRTRLALRGLEYVDGVVTIDRRLAVSVTRGLNAEDADQIFDFGSQALQQGHLFRAITALTQAVILAPERGQYYETLGFALLAKRKTEYAEAAFRTALNLQPELIQAHRKLGLILGADGRLEEAIEHFQQVLELEPSMGEMHVRMAILQYYQNRLDESREQVRLAEALGTSIPPQFARLLNQADGMPPEGHAVPPALQADPPVIGTQMRVDVTNPEQGNETTAACSEFDPECVLAGWNDYRTDDIRAGFSLTFDGGASWQDFLLRPPVAFQSGVEGDPMTCTDHRTGNLWAGAISFGDNGGVYVARKNAGETVFQPSVMAAITGDADKGWMAAGLDPFDAAATRLYLGYNQGLLFSTDQGNSWTGPIPFPEFGLGWLPRVGPVGELYLTYWDIDDGVKLLRSFDGGATLEGPFTVATRMDVWFVDGSRFPGRFRVAPLVTSAVDPRDGTVYVTWFDTTNIVNGNRNVDIYFSRSTDQGLNWSAPAIVNTDAPLPGDQFFPWIEVDNAGRVHMLFYDTRSIPQDDNVDDDAGFPPAIIEAWYAYSDDAGANWSELILTPQPFSSADDGFADGFIGDYLGMGVAGTTVYPCYMSTQEGTANIYVHQITNPFLLGDINRDGIVNLLDVDPLVELLSSGDYDKAADINGDGNVDLLDIDPFIALLTSN